MTFFFFGLDQGSKFLLEPILKKNSISIIPNFFDLELVYNTGASFSILENQMFILIGISIFCLITLQWIKPTIKDSKFKLFSYCLLYGGIVGNLLDRIAFGHVRDFFKWNIFGYNFPVFNVADIEIVIGVLLLIYVIWKEEEGNGKNRSRNRRKNKN